MKHPSPRRVPRLRALLALAALSLTLPAAASADVNITNFKAGPVAAFNNPNGLAVAVPASADPSVNDTSCTYLNPAAPLLQTQAGATTDYCVSFSVDGGDAVTGEDIDNTLVGLPVGTQAAIDTATKCSPAQFAQASPAPAACPGASQVGTVLAKIQVPTGQASPAFTTQNSPGVIYALDTPDGKAAQFGVALIGPAVGTIQPYTESKSTITVSQLGDPKVGLQNQTSELSRTTVNPAAPTTPVPIALQALSLRFWGSAAAHPHLAQPLVPTSGLSAMASDFFMVGTTCQTPQTANLTVNPYTGVNPFTQVDQEGKPTTATTTYNLTGCDSLPFTPSFSAAISGDTAPGGHPTLTIGITNPQGNDDLGSTTITLPVGLSTDLKNVQGGCALDTFNAGGCPTTSIIGSVSAELSGIASGQAGGVVHKVVIPGQTLPGIGLQFTGRLPLRVVGTTAVDASGRVVNTFTGLPSLPERSLKITINGGASGILQLPPAGTKCQQSGYDATIGSQNGKSKSFSVRTTCAEQLTARLDHASSRRPTLTVGGAGATGKKIQTIRLNLPKGLTINKNKSQSGIKVDHLETAVTGATKRARLSASLIRFTIAKPGSNGVRILTKTGTLAATSKFAKSDADVTVDARIVYTDGSKATQKITLTRK
ncbi:MAG: hypothetical protein AAGC46_08735 [Solirubrobacteraceae bacterium]|nr:hypothetical protein [Patulibacter sp.]